MDSSVFKAGALISESYASKYQVMKARKRILGSPTLTKAIVLDGPDDGAYKPVALALENMIRALLTAPYVK